jgi:hypothetical protein
LRRYREEVQEAEKRVGAARGQKATPGQKDAKKATGLQKASDDLAETRQAGR